jgi:Zn-finger protein
MSRKKTRSNCLSYPCHIGIEEKDFYCDLCFCPLFPCGDETKGKWLTNTVWDCSDCIDPHTKEFVDQYKFMQKHLN